MEGSKAANPFAGVASLESKHGVGWAFAPMVSSDTFDAEIRVFATEVYAQVIETMVAEINSDVDKAFRS